ncbi:MAG: WXG100 family type VII secretion target [Anaerolineae bacterium]|nr:WXG100 family type VII secretion target [Anaerolineae bacterium]
MTDEIKLVYATAEDMIRIFEQGVEQLENTMQEMQGIANTLEDGALLGRGGEAFTDAIRSKLCPAISRLNDKFQELAGDVQKAIDYMQQADRTSASKF